VTIVQRTQTTFATQYHATQTMLETQYHATQNQLISLQNHEHGHHVQQRAPQAAHEL
jgi:hypothetical protein